MRGDDGDNTLIGGTGANFINGDSGENILTSGVDNLSNTDSDVVILAYAGNDSIVNTGNSVTIDAGDGGNLIEGSEGQDTIFGFKATDTLEIGDDVPYLKHANGNDVIISLFDEDTISITLKDAASLSSLNIIGVEGLYIDNGANNTLIEGTDNDDFIVSSGSNVTINAARGRDTVSLTGDGGNLIQAPKRNNIPDGLIVYGLKSNDTLQLADGNVAYGKTTIGNDLVIEFDWNNKVTLKGAANLSDLNIVGQEGLRIKNTLDAVLIEGSDGHDKIDNGYYSSKAGDSVTIDTGAGNDNIYNHGGSFVSIDAGTGDDSITNYGNSVTIDAGTGDDYIDNSGGDFSTINTGDGNDSAQRRGDFGRCQHCGRRRKFRNGQLDV